MTFAQIDSRQDPSQRNVPVIALAVDEEWQNDAPTTHNDIHTL